jgi:hypothetical protein
MNDLDQRRRMLASIEEADAWVGEAISEARSRFVAERPFSINVLSPFVHRALAPVGISAENWPQMIADLPPAYPLRVSFDEAERVIHLQPGEFDPWDVLHMVAHWLAPHDRHGEGWRNNYIKLVSVGIGDDEADELAIAIQIWKPIPPGAIHHDR